MGEWQGGKEGRKGMEGREGRKRDTSLRKRGLSAWLTLFIPHTLTAGKDVDVYIIDR